jgi:hypothetical protein
MWVTLAESLGALSLIVKVWGSFDSNTLAIMSIFYGRKSSNVISETYAK